MDEAAEKTIESQQQSDTVEETKLEPRKKLISERFLAAKEEQRAREEERTSNFKAQRVLHNVSSISGRFEQALSIHQTNETMKKQQTRDHTLSGFQITTGTGFVKRRISEYEVLFMQIASAESVESTIKKALAERQRKLKIEYDANINSPVKSHSDGEQNIAISPEISSDLSETNVLSPEGQIRLDEPEVFTIGNTQIYDINTFGIYIFQIYIFYLI